MPRPSDDEHGPADRPQLPLTVVVAVAESENDVDIKSCRSDDGDPMIPRLQDLPAELLSQIYVWSGNSRFGVVCRRFHESSQSRAVRSRWLIQRYGRGKCLEQARFYPWFSDALVVSLLRSGVTLLLRRGDADAGSDVIKTSATLRWLAREGLVRSVEAVLAMQGVVHVPVPDDTVDGLSSAHLGEAMAAAAAEGHLPVVATLIKCGANVHWNEDAALRLAASNGHLPVVRTLLAITTANIAAKSNYAIRYAACNGHVDIVRLLYEHGADPFESDFAERGSRANRHHDVLCFLEEQRRVSGVVVEAI